MKLVIVESPYAGNVQRNLWYVWSCLRDCLLRGEAPFASHAIYTLPNVLDDTIPAERRLGIDAGYRWAEKADMAVFYTDLGWSKGMYRARERYDRLAFPYAYRTLPNWTQPSEEPDV